MAREREYNVLTRFNEKESTKYKKLVEKSKLTQQEYNLKCLLGKDIVVIDGIKELALQVRKVGVNINQIAHITNANNVVTKNDITNLQIHMGEIWDLLNDFLTKIK